MSTETTPERRNAYPKFLQVREETAKRVAEHVIAYLDSQAWTWALRPTSVLILSSVFFLLGGGVLGSACTIAYTAWAVVGWSRRFTTVVDLINLLGPALEKTPGGLDDIAVTATMFSEAKVAAGLNRQARINRLQVVAGEWFGKSGKGTSFDCSSGHGVICGHRTSSDARKFWSLIGTGR